MTSLASLSIVAIVFNPIAKICKKGIDKKTMANMATMASNTKVMHYKW